jgi:hypothetical protein
MKQAFIYIIDDDGDVGAWSVVAHEDTPGASLAPLGKPANEGPLTELSDHLYELLK